MAQEKLKTMLMQTFAVTTKEHYGMLWYFLEWSIVCSAVSWPLNRIEAKRDLANLVFHM